MRQNLSGTYWDNRYEDKNTGWDVGDITTPLKKYIDQLKNKDISILIPGCGNAYVSGNLIRTLQYFEDNAIVYNFNRH